MDFEQQLAAYKKAIDADIAAYSQHVLESTGKQYGRQPQQVSNAFLDLLSRGGKRIRGALVMVGYEMCGGRDRTMIVRAATAIEMMHAYMLLIDDIQDRSVLRRGKPTVHKLLEKYHKDHHLRGDSAHAGVSLALNAAVSGAHAAHMLLAGLEADPQLRLNALGIVDHTMIVTAYGQTYDIVNQMSDTVKPIDIERAMEYKTAHYTFLNPLCVGMVLAGAGCESTDAIRQYALHAGVAFQIMDDLKGLYGNEAQTGKDPLDDIREGKQTYVMHEALKRASPTDQLQLKRCLGNPQVTKADFEIVKRIVAQSGAKNAAEQAAARHAETARYDLKKQKQGWEETKVAFLDELIARLAL